LSDPRQGDQFVPHAWQNSRRVFISGQKRGVFGATTPVFGAKSWKRYRASLQSEQLSIQLVTGRLVSFDPGA
jgi:hypothetical protein